MPKLTVAEALWAHHEGRFGVAFRALNYWAAQGEASAFTMLGYMYDAGQGTRKNKAKAKHWYEKAYAAGESIAALNLAAIYRDSRQPVLELAWYKRAAELGDGDALVEVGIRYLSGKGTRRNPGMAEKCFAAALRSKNISEGGRDAAQQLMWGLK